MVRYDGDSCPLPGALGLCCRGPNVHECSGRHHLYRAGGSIRLGPLQRESRNGPPSPAWTDCLAHAPMCRTSRRVAEPDDRGAPRTACIVAGTVHARVGAPAVRRTYRRPSKPIGTARQPIGQYWMCAGHARVSSELADRSVGRARPAGCRAIACRIRRAVRRPAGHRTRRPTLLTRGGTTRAGGTPRQGCPRTVGGPRARLPGPAIHHPLTRTRGMTLNGRRMTLNGRRMNHRRGGRLHPTPNWFAVHGRLVLRHRCRSWTCSQVLGQTLLTANRSPAVPAKRKRPPDIAGRPFPEYVRRRPTLPRSGPRSTIGAEGLSFRVRDETGRFPFAMAAETLWRYRPVCPLGRSTVSRELHSGRVASLSAPPKPAERKAKKIVASPRPISTGRLHALPHFHLRPINPVVCRGPYSITDGKPNLEASFPLRCFQRLSLPNVANQQCSWRNNWHTRGSSVPVLSY